MHIVTAEYISSDHCLSGSKDAFSCHAQKICRSSGKIVLKNSRFVPCPFSCSSDISKNFPVAKDLCENPADTGIIIADLFLGKSKICFNRKPFSMFGRTSPVDRCCAGARSYMTESILALPIRSRFGYSSTTDDQIFLCIPAVTQNDDMFLAEKFRHNLMDHGSCQFQFGFFFLPHTIA